MDLYEVADQIVKLLQQRGRLTYRVLKRQFELDDDVLEDLKEEILYAQPQVVDDEGKGLIWTGETEATPATTSQPVQPAPQPVVEPIQPAHVETPPGEPRTPDAERRQLTVMFCDLVGSTALSGQLDPEDLRHVIQAYQETSANIIQEFEGYIAQYLGDGLLVYFGWPQAHEDDAHRAIHTALGIVDAIGRLNTRLEANHGVRLAVRLGIHTGPVVVGKIGGGNRHETLALGETPNIAARLEGLASPNTVMISYTTRRLTAAAFDCEDLGAPLLKGVTETRQVFRVRRVRAESRFDVASTMLMPIVGREAEVSLLIQRWEQALEGEGQVVTLGGSPGMGKSRLLQALCTRLADVPHLRLRYQCSPYHANTAFYPIASQMMHAMQVPLDAPPSEKLARLEALLAQVGLPIEESAPLFASVLSIPTNDQCPPLTWGSQHQKERTMELYVQGLVNLAQREPVLALFEDVHWIDPTSLEALSRMINQIQNARILVVVTHRSEFALPWTEYPHVTAYMLNRLSRRQTIDLIAQVTGGDDLPTEVLSQIIDKTDGIPLFIEELTKHVLESMRLTTTGEIQQPSAPAPPLMIPMTLHDSLMARLDRLASAKGIAQLGATIGRHFTYALIQAVTPLDDATLQHELERLVDAELIYQRGLPPEATYRFKHALIQDVAYNSLLVQRRKEWHRAVGIAIEALYPERLAEHYEELAHHFTQGEVWSKAMTYSTLAGDRAVEAFANIESRSQYARALHAAKQMQPALDAVELANLHAKYGAVLTVHRAFQEAVMHYQQALKLRQQMNDRRGEIRILAELSDLYRRCHDAESAITTINQAVAMAQELDDRSLKATCLVKRVAILSSGYGQLVETTSDAEEALRLSREVGDPSSLALSLVWLGAVLEWRADLDRSLVYIHEGLELAQQVRTSLVMSTGLFYIGLAYAAKGAYEEALAWYRQFSDFTSASGDLLNKCRLPNLIGGVHLELYDVDEALRLNLESDELSQQHFPWPEPRGHCQVKAGLGYLLRGEHGQADVCFRRAEALLEEDTWLRWRWHIALLRARGEQALTEARHDEAWRYATQSLELATQSDSRKHMVRAQLLQGEVLAATGRLDEATHVLDASVRLAEQIGTPREVWLGKSSLGKVLIRLNRDNEAEAQLSQAAQTIEAIASDLRTPRLRDSFLSAAPVVELYDTLGHRPPPEIV